MFGARLAGAGMIIMRVIEKSSALLLFNTKRNLSGPPSMRHVKSLDFINITDNRTGLHSSQASSVSLFVAGKA